MQTLLPLSNMRSNFLVTFPSAPSSISVTSSKTCFVAIEHKHKEQWARISRNEVVRAWVFAREMSMEGGGVEGQCEELRHGGGRGA